MLWTTGRHITMANVRQALVPGVFFGLNLAIFFAGATHNSVANAALIGSLAPFLIVPVGAWLFSEYIDPRALVFAVLAFGGVTLVLFSAPPNGDASLEGNVFGVIAMLLLVAYVASTKHFRREMDVTTFMATICPIAAVAVLPLALAHGGMFHMSGTGWTYMLILTFTSGVAAQGLLVFAQKTIQIGTIGIAQVAQPALAVVWSFLLLGEVVQRASDRRHRDRRHRPAVLRAPEPARRADPAISLTARASTRSSSAMKWEAASMRRSASSQRSCAVAASPACAATRPSASSANTSTGASSRRRASSRIPASRSSAPGTRSPASSAASRQSPSAACSPPPAVRCHASAASSAARAASTRPRARSTRPWCTRASAARRASPVASAFSVASSSVAAPAT